MWFKPILFQTLILTTHSLMNSRVPRDVTYDSHTPIKLPSSVDHDSVPPMHLAFDLDTIDDELKQTVGKKIVLQLSSLLPKVDTIGHDILHANNKFVVDVLANEQMSHEFKKDIILLSIKLAQHGDDIGSFFLQQYYNIVDYMI